MPSKAPFGEINLIVILPVASSVLMPEIDLALPFAYSAAPAILVVKNDEPAYFSLRARWIVYLKSEALTSWPLENFTPFRSVAVYVFPSLEMVGKSAASAGMTLV